MHSDDDLLKLVSPVQAIRGGYMRWLYALVEVNELGPRLY